MTRWLIVLLLVGGALVGRAGDLHGTVSIVATDPKTGSAGVAGASCIEGAHRIAVLVAGRGAGVSQGLLSETNRDLIQQLLAENREPEAILDAVRRRDGDVEHRQLAIVDAQGRVAAMTGREALAIAAHRRAAHVAVAGNLLRSERVLVAMRDAYAHTSGPLAERLLAALEAGNRAGGDVRCPPSQPALSAFLRVSGGPGEPELRLVAESAKLAEDPVRSLRRQLGAQRGSDERPSIGGGAAGLDGLPWLPSEGREVIGTPAPPWEDIEWVQGGPLRLEDLRGKVILLRFWLSGCPYCRNTAPALNALHAKYRGRGLVVVGLHHPKSAVTRQREVVERSARELGFEFPIGMDNEWKTIDRYWTGTGNRSFTSVSFLIDRRGIIRFVHDGGEFFPGEGEPSRAYQAVESMIRRLLAEEADVLSGRPRLRVRPDSEGRDRGEATKKPAPVSDESRTGIV